MARNVNGSRRPLLPEIDFSIWLGPSVRRGRSRRGRRRHVAFIQSRYFYGFLTSKDVGPHGSLMLGFECTDAMWFNDVIDNRIPYQHGIHRVRHAIGNRDYWTAWNNSIAQRVVLRRCFEHYREIAGSSGNPAPLAEFSIAIADDDGRIRPSLTPAADRLELGLWYGLEITATTSTGADIGILVEADRHTDAPQAPARYRLLAMNHLRSTPNPPVAQNAPFHFEPMFRSQAVLQAYHYARGQ